MLSVVPLRARPFVPPPPSSLSLLCGLVLCFVWPPPRVRWVCIAETPLGFRAAVPMYLFSSVPVRKHSESLLCVLDDQISSDSSSFDVLMAF